MIDDDVAALGRLIADAERILVFTGAGISTASGIPDYRGPQGVWNTRRPVQYQDFMTSAEARLTSWRQKLEDHDELAGAGPNAAHIAAVELERAGKLLMLVTQNVDGLHAVAGTSPDRLVEIHGTARLVECQTCVARDDAADALAEFRRTGVPPECGCGGYLKAATISFGQPMRPADVVRAMTAADRADLAISLGSSLVVYPAADIPIRATAHGAPYASVNLGPTDHDGDHRVTLRIEGDVTDVFPAAVAHATG